LGQKQKVANIVESVAETIAVIVEDAMTVVVVVVAVIAEIVAVDRLIFKNNGVSGVYTD
jgi:hypothetical protein